LAPGAPALNLTDELNDPQRERRLRAAAELGAAICGQAAGSEPREVNNHIHTWYSFSPYSPALAAWRSRDAGLATAGIMDHDSMAGAREFIEAGRCFGLATTVGVECRCDFSATGLRGRRINNPDQLSNAYIALHGVPHPRIEEVGAYFRPLREARGRRNRRMVRRLNALLEEPALRLSYPRDVLPLSRAEEGGSVTERHILFALARRLVAALGRGPALLEGLQRKLGLRPEGGVRRRLEEPANPYYEYDLLGALKSELVSSFYVDALEECPPVEEVVGFSRRIGAICAYAYLGDVAESVTGDKRPQSFEDGYLEELFALLDRLGFQAVTYMPNRNTPEQLARVQALCRRHGLFEISGVDINSPRQDFRCPEIHQPQFRHLVESTWALVGHELQATAEPGSGMFDPATLRDTPELQERVRLFARIGRAAAGGTDP
jgi:hypothetical protein